MNRRGFLKRFGIGVGAALALASLPVSALEGLSVPDAGRLCASAYLRKIYNEYSRGKSATQCPRVMEAGRELFDAYGGELLACQRFVPYAHGEPVAEWLAFKGARLKRVGHGWTAKVVA